MLNGKMLLAVERLVGEAMAAPFRAETVRRAGGSHEECWIAGSRGRFCFLKTAPRSRELGLAAEFLSLRRLKAADCLRVPEPYGLLGVGDDSCLAMEWLGLGHSGRGEGWRRFGAGLARLHSCPVAEINRSLGDSGLPEGMFGVDVHSDVLDCDPEWTASWPEAFVRGRIECQLRKAGGTGLRLANSERLLQRCKELLSHSPDRSLVHGDLWSGNAGFLRGGEPVAFDPAAYVADGETDLAMTELFGGFPGLFYEGYRTVRPIRDGYRRRRDVYSLYHILNHYNLFGESYRRQAQRLAQRIADAAD